MRRTSPPALLAMFVLAFAALIAAPGATLAHGARSHGSRCPDVDGPRCTKLLSTGIKMAYLETGPRNGHVVIMLHGWTDTVRSWSLSMEALHDLRPDLRIFALDARGHGASSMPSQRWCPRDPGRCFRRTQMAADVIAFMNAKGIRRATIVGHSMGSGVATELGLRHPRRVERLVLIGMGLPDAAGEAAFRDSLAPLLDYWEGVLTAQGYRWPQDAYNMPQIAVDPDAIAFMQAVWSVDPVASLALTDAIGVDAAFTPLGTFLGPLSANNPLLLGQMRGLSVPTLVLWGRQDAVIPFEPAERRVIEELTAAAVGRGSFTWKQYGVIPLPDTFVQTDDIGHSIQWEAPREVALDIDAFLRTGSPTPDLYRSGAPDDIRSIVTEPGAATIISAP